MSLKQHSAKENVFAKCTFKKPVVKTTKSQAPSTSRPVLSELENKTVNKVASKPSKTKEQAKNKAIIQKNKPQNETETSLVTKISGTRSRVVEQGFSTNQLFGISDPDAGDKDDQFLVAEYIKDIHSYLLSMEDKYSIRPMYLRNHTTTIRNRAVLINWLVEVHISYKFVQETLHLAVSILDRYLQINLTAGTNILQLIGIAAMLIAAKYEEMYTPEAKEFVYIADDSFTTSQLLKMEREILYKLKFNLGRPLSLHFLKRYSKIAKTGSKEYVLAKYFLEVCLLEYELCHIKPSIQAAGACCLAIAVIGNVKPSIVWNNDLIYHTSYKYSNIKSTIVNIAHYVSEMSKSKQSAIYEKYASPKLYKISLNEHLYGPLMKMLIDLKVKKS